MNPIWRLDISLVHNCQKTRIWNQEELELNPLIFPWGVSRTRLGTMESCRQAKEPKLSKARSPGLRIAASMTAVEIAVRDGMSYRNYTDFLTGTPMPK